MGGIGLAIKISVTAVMLIGGMAVCDEVDDFPDGFSFLFGVATGIMLLVGWVLF